MTTETLQNAFSLIGAHLTGPEAWRLFWVGISVVASLWILTALTSSMRRPTDADSFFYRLTFALVNIASGTLSRIRWEKVPIVGTILKMLGFFDKPEEKKP